MDLILIISHADWIEVKWVECHGTLVTRNGLRRDHSGLVVTKIGRYITLINACNIARRGACLCENGITI